MIEEGKLIFGLVGVDSLDSSFKMDSRSCPPNVTPGPVSLLPSFVQSLSNLTDLSVTRKY